MQSVLYHEEECLSFILYYVILPLFLVKGVPRIIRGNLLILICQSLFTSFTQLQASKK